MTIAGAQARRDRRGVRRSRRRPTRRPSSSTPSRSSWRCRPAFALVLLVAGAGRWPPSTTSRSCSALTLASAYLPLAFALLAPRGSSSGAWTTRASACCRRSSRWSPSPSPCRWPRDRRSACGPRHRAGGRLPRWRRRRARASSPYRAGAALRPRRRAALPALQRLRCSSRCVAAMVVAQGQVIAFKVDGGLAAAGYITLAATLTRYVDRADQIVTATIYPAICAIQGRTRALEELFVKSNRATLLWVAAVRARRRALRARPRRVRARATSGGRRVVLLQGLAVAGLLQQLGFNWFSFYRAHGDPRPPAVEAVGRRAVGVPACSRSRGLRCGGDDGFVVGRIAAVASRSVVRARYIRALLPGRAAARAAGARRRVPLAPAPRRPRWRCALAAVGRRADCGQAVAEAVLFLGVFVVGAACAASARCVAELVGAVRPAAPAPAAARPGRPPTSVSAGISQSQSMAGVQRPEGQRRRRARRRAPGRARATRARARARRRRAARASSARPTRPSSASVSSSSECASGTRRRSCGARSHSTREAARRRRRRAGGRRRPSAPPSSSS